MEKLNFKYLVLSAVVLSTYFISFGQSNFKVVESESKLVISGTSSVHDWDIDVTKFLCEASLLQSDNKEISISRISFTCPVENIKSNNKTMNNKTFEALKGDKFPLINFNSTEKVVVLPVDSGTKINGKLTIAGKTNDVTLQLKVVSENQNQIKVKGETHLKMSDYGINPPTAMLGTLKTGDNVVITYDIILQKTQEIN